MSCICHGPCQRDDEHGRQGGIGKRAESQGQGAWMDALAATGRISSCPPGPGCETTRLEVRPVGAWGQGAHCRHGITGASAESRHAIVYG